jgi:hypothetical protein
MKISILAVILLWPACCLADTFEFNANPAVASGSMGGTVNLGYTFTNTSPNLWALIGGGFSIETPPAKYLQCQAAYQGQCYDSYLLDPVVFVAPSSTVSSPTGFASFIWSPTVPEGYSFTGLLTAQVGWTSHNPFTTCCSFDGGSETASARYTAVVTPEPGTWALMGLGLTALLLKRFRPPHQRAAR